MDLNTQYLMTGSIITLALVIANLLFFITLPMIPAYILSKKSR